MKADMVDSQLAILEPLAPEEKGVVIDNAGEPESVQNDIRIWLETL